MNELICIAYPTIIDGLVLRWWINGDAYEHGGREVASASRNCIMTEPGCPAEIRTLADKAHSYLSVEYAASFHPTLDVSRWVTHETVGIFSRAVQRISK